MQAFARAGSTMRVCHPSLLSTKPDLIFYGIYENDFHETIDFYNWTKSGLDWFSYHSGLWGGPPKDDSFLITALPGTYGIYRLLKRRYLTKERSIDDEYGDRDIEKIISLIKDAQDLSLNVKVNFLLILIPSKFTLVKKDSKSKGSITYDKIISSFEGSGLNILDLRPHFLMKDPETMYYKIDAHWNEAGMLETASLVLDYYERQVVQSK